MGSTTSKNDGEDRLAIECMAKYMSITKQQLIDLRNRCYMGMDGKRKISRRTFNSNVQQCKIRESPDAEILNALFTMWDLHGEDRILFPPFILSLTPLACEDEDLEKTLTFALGVFERETKGILSADRLVFILKYLNQTASYFGDSVLTLRQIYKVVDNAFDIMSVVSQEGPLMSHAECIQKLSTDPILLQFMSKDLKKTPRVTFSSVSRIHHEDGSELSASVDTISLPLTPIARVRLPSADTTKSVLKKSNSNLTVETGDSGGRQPFRAPWMRRK